MIALPDNGGDNRHHNRHNHNHDHGGDNSRIHVHTLLFLPSGETASASHRAIMAGNDV